MYKYLIIALFSIFVVACGKSGDKRAQLEKLRKQKDQVSEQIKSLEKELAVEGVKDQTEKKFFDVSATEVKTQPFSHYVEIQGKLDGDDNVGVFVQTQGGIVKNIYAKEGDAVKKGQVLAQLDDMFYQQTLQEVQTLLQLQTDLYDKQKTLWDQKIGSEVQYISAKANKEATEKRIATLKSQMELCKIVSPIDGTVEEVGIKIGQMAIGALPSFRVVNFAKIKVTADIAESYSANVKKGDEVLLSFPDLKSEISANIDFTSRFINPINRTFNVQIRFVPSGQEFRANMITVVKIRNYYAPKALVVPINVVQNDSKGAYVYVAETTGTDFTAKKYYVKKGEEYDGNIEIKEGIKEGDKVITSGYQTIEEGQFVKF